MTDLEMTKLCAEAMGFTESVHYDPRTPACKPPSILIEVSHHYYEIFDPLNDDARAMALVKRFRPHMNANKEGSWWVLSETSEGKGPDLNRAIVECVAKLKPSPAAPNVGTQEE